MLLIVAALGSPRNRIFQSCYIFILEGVADSTEVGVAVADLQTAARVRKRRKKETNITTPDPAVNLAVTAAVAVNTDDTGRGMSGAEAHAIPTSRLSAEIPKRERTRNNTNRTMKW